MNTRKCSIEEIDEAFVDSPKTDADIDSTLLC